MTELDREYDQIVHRTPHSYTSKVCSQSDTPHNQFRAVLYPDTRSTRDRDGLLITLHRKPLAYELLRGIFQRGSDA